MTFFKRLATQGAIGYSVAPGTYATVMAIPMVWVLTHMQLSIVYYCMIAAILWLSAWYIVNRALPEFDETDPSEIVLDEMTSFAFVFIGIVPSVWTLLVGFALFRLFDIYKPLGIACIEHVHGALGIMLDDLIAALLSCACLYMLMHIGLLQ